MTHPVRRKPLGHKSYGSIPHLPGSRRGPGDRGLQPDQCVRLLEAPKDRHDRVIVQEKLDGANVGIARIGGDVVALTRAGVLAGESDYPQHRAFAAWVARHPDRWLALLRDGERVCGEWLAMAHGTIYDPTGREPFVAFDLRVRHDRAPVDEVIARCADVGVATAPIIHDGPPLSIPDALRLVETSRYGAIDPTEGAVWRLEYRGRPLMIAKYVKHDKADGTYLPDVSGEPAVWCWNLPVPPLPEVGP